MSFTTEYADNYVWHKNAYVRPEVYAYKNTMKKDDRKYNESQLGTMKLFFHDDVGFPCQFLRKGGTRNRKNSNGTDEEVSKKSMDLKGFNFYQQQQNKRFATGARGIKSHFLSATINVILDFGISYSDMQKNDEKIVHQYFKSVYKQDYCSLFKKLNFINAASNEGVLNDN